MSAAFISLDLAKSVFQVHGVDVQGKGGCDEAAAAGRGAGVLRQPASVRGWDGGVCRIAFLILLVIRRDRRVETWNPLEEGADVDASVAD